MDIIAGIQNALAIVGKLRELGKTVEDAEFKMMLADLSNELADAKLEAANLKMEIARLSTENQSLTDRLNTKETVRPVFADGGYRFPGDDGLYCTGCFDSRGEKIRFPFVKTLDGFDFDSQPSLDPKWCPSFVIP